MSPLQFVRQRPFAVLGIAIVLWLLAPVALKRLARVSLFEFGAPVIFTGGVVGRVSEVYAYTSVVDLISSPTLRIAAMVDGDSRPFSFQGGPNPPFAQARGSVEFVPLDIFASPESPKRIVTAGLGGVFPPGIVIGHVQNLELDTGGLFKSGNVLLDPRLNELHEVAVLVPLNPEQQE